MLSTKCVMMLCYGYVMLYVMPLQALRSAVIRCEIFINLSMRS